MLIGSSGSSQCPCHNNTKNKKKSAEIQIHAPKSDINNQPNFRQRKLCQLDLLGDGGNVVPLDLAIDVLDLLKLVAKLDNGEVDHTRIETEGAADRRLNGAGGVEAHDKVVTFVVSGLMFRSDFG